MKKLCILGSTGSIGENTLDIVRQHPDLYRIVSLSAHTQIDKLAKQAREFLPQVVVVANQALAQKISSMIDLNQTRVLWGETGLLEAVLHPDVDTVMAAIVGAAGLLPTLESARSGKRVLLAKKPTTYRFANRSSSDPKSAQKELVHDGATLYLKQLLA